VYEPAGSCGAGGTKSGPSVQPASMATIPACATRLIGDDINGSRQDNQIFAVAREMGMAQATLCNMQRAMPSLLSSRVKVPSKEIFRSQR
jgi:hypothetical protein